MTSTTIEDAPLIEPSTQERRNYLNDEYGVQEFEATVYVTLDADGSHREETAVGDF